MEINLIQENKPRYNIMLKDDKSYPFIKITKERHPRLLITRQIKKDGGQYLVPIPMWVRPTRPSNYWNGSILSASVNCLRTSIVFIIIWGNVWHMEKICPACLTMTRWPRKLPSS